MQNIIYLLIFALTVSFSNSTLASEPVKLLNWWDYLDQKIIDDLHTSGFKVQLTVYKTNDVAAAFLANNKINPFEVVIVSNQIAQGLIEANLVVPMNNNFQLLRNQQYRFLKSEVQSCLPFMWSTTVFARNNSDQIVTPAPHDLLSLTKLKSNGLAIGIIDDKLEMAARITADNHSHCAPLSPDYNYENINSDCWRKSAQELKNYLKPTNFVNSVYEILSKKQSAVYGWHGEIAPALKSNKNISITLPRKQPVVGYDAICILKDPKRTKLRMNELEKFVAILGSPLSTTNMATSTQYFSPYSLASAGLTPAIDSLRKSILEQIDKNNYLILRTPTPKEHGALNKFWRGFRYGS